MTTPQLTLFIAQDSPGTDNGSGGFIHGAEAFVGQLEQFTGYILPFLLVGAGVYFCYRTGFVQLRRIGDMFRSITEKPAENDQHGISAFKAFTLSAASRVGVGNISGVALAISLGGPGAVFWMWITALVGGATSFVESTLAQLYKSKDTSGYHGGPAYYMTRGLKARPLAFIFAIAITFTYGFVFNAVQSNTIADAMSSTFNADGNTIKIIVGILLAILTGLVIFGGVTRIASVTQVIVPFMAVIYIMLGIVVIALNVTAVPGMILEIIQSAFGFKEIGGATLGIALMEGMKRGLFSNEAGMGSVPNAAATAAVSHPAKQGLSQTLGVYFDTFLVCTITAFIILLSQPEYNSKAEGVALTQRALEHSVGPWGLGVLTIIIFFLAFSSVLGNYYYGQANIEFFTDSKTAMNVFRVLVLLCVFGGAIGTVPLVWSLAAVFSAIMVIVNLCAIVPLCGTAVKLLTNYEQQRSQGLNPVFHRDDLPELENIECWDGTDPITVRK